MYPTTIPTKNGMIFKNPFPLTITKAVVKNVISATNTPFHAMFSVPAAIPILPTAELANPKPIIIIIGPITTGGNNLSIQFLPINLIIVETIT